MVSSACRAGVGGLIGRGGGGMERGRRTRGRGRRLSWMGGHLLGLKFMVVDLSLFGLRGRRPLVPGFTSIVLTRPSSEVPIHNSPSV